MSSKVLPPSTHVEPLPWEAGGETASVALDDIAAIPQRDGNTAGENAAWRNRTAELELELQRMSSRLIEERRSGVAEGRQMEANASLARWNESQAAMARSLADLASLRPKFRRDVEEDAIRLSLAIARKIIRREIQVDGEALQGLVRVALEKVSARDFLAIRTFGPDAQGLGDRLAALGLPSHVRVQADPLLPQGALLVESTHGVIDVSVDTQLKEIERGLIDAIDRHGA